MIQLFTGIIVSIVHVVSGPDHLAAITPLAIESKNKSWTVGFAWGIGHTLGMLIIGILFILFKEYINVELVSSYGEQVVGFLLIIIGLWSIYKVYSKHGSKKHAHIHPHSHKEEVHVHEHIHSENETHVHKHKNPNKQNVITALSIGVVHGVAGVSHLIAILPTLALPSTADSVLYLSGFGIGTIVAMIVFAVVLGFIAIKSDVSNNKNIFKILRIIGGLLAIGIGVFWIVLSF